MSNKKIVFLFVAPLLAVMFWSVRIYYDLAIWKYDGPSVVFTVSPGEGFSKINGRLAKMGLISSPKVFHRYCQLKDYLGKFRTGSFEITNGSNLTDVADILIYGKAITITVTIPEGKNIYDIGKILEERKVTSYQEFISLAKDPQFVKSLDLTGDSVEGYLFPDTYSFPPQTPAALIITTMVRQFKKHFQNMDFSNSKLSPHEVVILASIVEKETGAPEERPLIAGVFLNRLKKRMRLQSDPTTIYGSYEKFEGNLSKKDLQIENPYNTYKIPGLPIGPICNPGIKSIEAVLNPEVHGNFYFVSKNDGTHIFSPTYTEHSRAVKEWQQNRRNREGKSWRDLSKRNQ
jgi:UPF0755 protein